MDVEGDVAADEVPKVEVDIPDEDEELHADNDLGTRLKRTRRVRSHRRKGLAVRRSKRTTGHTAPSAVGVRFA